MLFSTDLTHSTLGEQKVLHFCLLDLWQTGWSRDRLIFELNNFGTILECCNNYYGRNIAENVSDSKQDKNIEIPANTKSDSKRTHVFASVFYDNLIPLLRLQPQPQCKLPSVFSHITCFTHNMNHVWMIGCSGAVFDGFNPFNFG